jgi:hypothetical protein
MRSAEHQHLVQQIQQIQQIAAGDADGMNFGPLMINKFRWVHAQVPVRPGLS